MPIFAVTNYYSADVATRDALRVEHRDHLRSDLHGRTETVTSQSRTSLHTLLRILCGAVRRLCPTWEEWQAAVDLHPVAGLGP
jgi:hypothetical protein